MLQPQALHKSQLHTYSWEIIHIVFLYILNTWVGRYKFMCRRKEHCIVQFLLCTTIIEPLFSSNADINTTKTLSYLRFLEQVSSLESNICNRSLTHREERRYITTRNNHNTSIQVLFQICLHLQDILWGRPKLSTLNPHVDLHTPTTHQLPGRRRVRWEVPQGQAGV